MSISVPSSQPPAPGKHSGEDPTQSHAWSAEARKLAKDGKQVKAELKAIALTADEISELSARAIQLDMDLKSGRLKTQAEVGAARKELDVINLTIERGHYFVKA